MFTKSAHNLQNKEIMKRKQIIEILKTHQTPMAGHSWLLGIGNGDFEKVADAILALPLEVPSDGEIKKEIFKRTTEPVPYTGKSYIPKPIFRFMEEISEWIKDEIIKRNK